MAFRGDLIKAWREAKGLSQDAIAEQLHITQTFWSAMEGGRRSPSTGLLVEISKMTGLSVDDLLGNPTQPLPTQETEQGEKEAV